MTGAVAVAPGRSGALSVRGVIRSRHGRTRLEEGQRAGPFPMVGSDPGRCQGRVHEGDDQDEGEQTRQCTAPGAVGAPVPKPPKPDHGRGHEPRRSGHRRASQGGRCRPPARCRLPARDRSPAIEQASPDRPTLHVAPLGTGIHPDLVTSPGPPCRTGTLQGRRRHAHRPGGTERASAFERSAPAHAIRAFRENHGRGARFRRVE